MLPCADIIWKGEDAPFWHIRVPKTRYDLKVSPYKNGNYRVDLTDQTTGWIKEVWRSIPPRDLERIIDSLYRLLAPYYSKEPLSIYASLKALRKLTCS